MDSKFTAVFTLSIGALCCGALFAQTDPSAAPASDSAAAMAGAAAGAGAAPAAAEAAAPPAADATAPQLPAFYGELAPFGTWVAGGSYGWMWVPAKVPAGWQPYTIGHWAISSYGWTWMSDEPFGYVTYHYGRWFRDDERGWVWLPADSFAPAWVDWRAGDGYIGWAPLPPDATAEPAGADYSFVKESALLAPRVPDILLPAADTEAILPGTARVAAPLSPDERPGRFRRALPYINAFLEGVSEGLDALPTPNAPHASAAGRAPAPPTGTAHPVSPATLAPTRTAHPTTPGTGSSAAAPAHPTSVAKPANRPAAQAAPAPQPEASRPQPLAAPPAPPAETHSDHH